MTPADRAREAAATVELVKVRASQNKDGYYITFSVHPNDMPVDLVMAHSGTRYLAVLVQLSDQDEPVMPKDAVEGALAVTSAAMLCRNPKFQAWMVKHGMSPMATEDAVSEAVRDYCGIVSRGELRTNPLARKVFLSLRKDFEDELF